MREFDALKSYDRRGTGRSFRRGWRGVEERLVAMERSHDYYHGGRQYGFGGFVNDGRWEDVARDLVRAYHLAPGQSVLQLGCDFGFLLEALRQEVPGLEAFGMDPSPYALSQASEGISRYLSVFSSPRLPFPDNSFDFIISTGLVYTLPLRDAATLLEEIERVSRSSAYVTLATYSSPGQLEAFYEWSLLATTVLPRKQWTRLLELVGYKGDYSFVDADSLGLHLV